jgi:hypothetical protein
MTVDASYIQNISPYKLNTDFTPTQFTLYYDLAYERMSNEHSGYMSGNPKAADYCIAMLICDRIWWTQNGDEDVTSESISGYSYSLRMGANSRITSPWLDQYNHMIEAYGGEAIGAGGILRDDYVPPKELKLSDQPTVRPRNLTDTNLKAPSFRTGL